MLATLKKLGTSGGIGFLFGIAAVWFIAPTTPGGTGLIMAIVVVSAMVIGQGISYLKNRQQNKHE